MWGHTQKQKQNLSSIEFLKLQLIKQSRRETTTSWGEFVVHNRHTFVYFSFFIHNNFNKKFIFFHDTRAPWKGEKKKKKVFCMIDEILELV